MGTNYYLYKKAKYAPINKRSKDWYETYDFEMFDSPLERENYVQELKNGFVWHDTYYPSVRALNKDYYAIYHIGKSSYGWRFLLATYPKQHIDTLEDWKKLFNDENNYIQDEYGEIIDKETMLKIITDRPPVVNPATANNQKEIKNGLYVHGLSDDFIKDNSANETYDVCRDWDFS